MHNDKVKEFELIRESLNGNKAAFDDLIRPYIKPMYNVCYKILNSAEDAEDVCQESLIKIYKNLSSFKMNAKFFTWVYRICVNTAKDLIKKRSKESGISLDQQLAESGDYILLSSDKAVATPEKLLAKKELYNEIMATLSSLPLNLRSAIILRDVEGFSYAEIAEILEKNLNTVKSDISRARKLAVKDLINKGIAPSAYERGEF